MSSWLKGKGWRRVESRSSGLDQPSSYFSARVDEAGVNRTAGSGVIRHQGVRAVSHGGSIEAGTEPRTCRSELRP